MNNNQAHTALKKMCIVHTKVQELCIYNYFTASGQKLFYLIKSTNLIHTLCFFDLVEQKQKAKKVIIRAS